MEKDQIKERCKMFIIGGSAGSLDVILKILPNIKSDITFPIVLVLHRKSSAGSSLSDLFATRTVMPVKEVEDKEAILPATIYLAPANYHLLFEKNNYFSLDYSEKVNYSRPSIDVTYESAADVYGKTLTCLFLSGANADGVEGLKLVKQNGGNIMVQNPEFAESPFMPQQALLRINVDRVLDIKDMASLINSL